MTATNISPSSQNTISYPEQEVRKNFGVYVNEIVATNGKDLGGKRNISFESMVQRVNIAVEAAKKYKSTFG